MGKKKKEKYNTDACEHGDTSATKENDVATIKPLNLSNFIINAPVSSIAMALGYYKKRPNTVNDIMKGSSLPESIKYMDNLDSKIHDDVFRILLRGYILYLSSVEHMNESEITQNILSGCESVIAAIFTQRTQKHTQENLITSIVERDGKIVMRKKAYSSEDLDKEYLGIPT